MTFFKRALATAGSLALLGGGLILGAAPAQAISCPPGQVLVDLGAMGQACQQGPSSGGSGSGTIDYGGGGGSNSGSVSGPPVKTETPYGPTPGYQPPVQSWTPPAPVSNPPAYSPPVQAPQYQAPVTNTVPAPSAPVVADAGAVPEAAVPGPDRAVEPASSRASALPEVQAREAKAARVEMVRGAAEEAVLRARVAAAVEQALSAR